MGDLSEMPGDILIIEMEIRLQGGFQVAGEQADGRPLERLPDLRGDDLARESARTLRVCRRIPVQPKNQRLRPVLWNNSAIGSMKQFAACGWDIFLSTLDVRFSNRR